MKLKGTDGKEYTGEINGSVFAVWDANKKNVGNFKHVEDAVKLGGFSIVAQAASPEGETPATPPASTPEKSEGQTEQPKTDTPPAATPPQTEAPKEGEKAAA